MTKTRCTWATGTPEEQRYHDEEWGVPVYDERRLFEMLILEGAQAGLSWSTILKKREGYRRAFDGFDAERIARYSRRSVERLLKDPGIVRNRLKVEATINNAKRFLEVQATLGSFSDYLWQFVDGRPIVNRWQSLAEIPAATPESDAMSKALKKRGFKFVGSTIVYAHMQATGIVNDHVTGCFRYKPCAALAKRP